MSTTLRNRLKTTTAEKKGNGIVIFFMLWVLLVFPLLLSQGCNEQTYKEQQLRPSVNRIVLFEIEGTDGNQFTKMLGTELAKLGRRIIYGDQFDKPSDLLAAAKTARDTDADVFIVGQITKSEVVDYSKYTISGTFMLHEVENGDQIGGIADVHYTENLDSIGRAWVDMSDFTAGVLGEKHRESADRKRKDLERKVEAMSPKVQRLLAKKVAKELSKELGTISYNQDQ